MSVPHSPTEAGRGPPSAASPAPARTAEPVNLAREPPVRLGALRIEPARRRVVHDDGREKIVQPRVMQVLVALVRAEGQIVTRDDLLASCWRGIVVGDDAISRVIGRVRRLADGFDAGLFELETITKVGYRLIPPARPTLDEPAARPSVCVLPFANMSDDPQQAYLSDGFTEDVIAALGKVSALLVVAQSAAFALRDKGLDPAQIAHEFKVGHVLEGSVRQSGERVRITAHLVDVATGGQVWAERYDRGLADIFALQDEIAEAVVRALQLPLSADEKQAIERKDTASPEAYALYLLARRYYAAGWEGDPRSLEAVERLSRRAVEIDPGYARAWALLGIARTLLRFGHAWSGDNGLRALERALSVNPDLAEAHAVKGRHLWTQGRIDEAYAEIEIALGLAPDSWEANAEAGRLNYMERRFDEAIPFWAKAAHVKEASKSAAGMLMVCHASIGDMEGARRAARLTLARTDETLSTLDGAAIDCGAGALAVLGEPDRARDLIRRALLIDPDNVRMRYNFGCGAVIYLHDHDLALDLLAPAFAAMSADWMRQVAADPDLDALRGDRRFRAMLAAAQARLAQ